MSKKYNNIMPLGFFCSPALELDRFCLRNASYPFDWVISPIKGVLSLIDNTFENFLAYENLAQNTTNRNYYKDTLYHIEFFHDFSRYIPLELQYIQVKEKYDRRVRRFYKSIQQPTLFLRYMQGKEEAAYIEKNINDIFSLLKKLNKHNDIIFIANSENQINIQNVFFVEPDDNDSVARNFLHKNQQLKKHLMKRFKITPYIWNRLHKTAFFSHKKKKKNQSDDDQLQKTEEYVHHLTY